MEFWFPFLICYLCFHLIEDWIRHGHDTFHLEKSLVAGIVLHESTHMLEMTLELHF
jgi:hypothetical protein